MVLFTGAVFSTSILLLISTVNTTRWNFCKKIISSIKLDESTMHFNSLISWTESVAWKRISNQWKITSFHCWKLFIVQTFRFSFLSLCFGHSWWRRWLYYSKSRMESGDNWIKTHIQLISPPPLISTSPYLATNCDPIVVTLLHNNGT